MLPADEPPLDLREVVGRNAHAVIDDVETHVIRLARRSHGYRFCLPGVANRVVDQVVEREHDGGSIGPHRRQIRRHVYFEPNVAVGQLAAKSLRRFGDERCRFERSRTNRPPSRRSRASRRAGCSPDASDVSPRARASARTVSDPGSVLTRPRTSVSPTARMVESGVFSSWVTVATKSARTVATAALARAARAVAMRLSASSATPAPTTKRLRRAPRAASTNVGSPAALAAIVHDRCVRSAGGSTASDRGIEEQDRKDARGDGLRESRFQRAGDATAVVVDHRERRGAGVPGDLSHLLQDVVEIVVAGPRRG